jgi:hypothetical protein
MARSDESGHGSFRFTITESAFTEPDGSIRTSDDKDV